MNRHIAAGLLFLVVANASPRERPLLPETGGETDPPPTPRRSFYEVELTAECAPPVPGGFQGLEVEFTRPDGSVAVVDGFHKGGRSYGARAYCDLPGVWHWHSRAKDPGMDDRRGEFRVVPSKLPGKLRIHTDDPRQMQYDNGDWFLHIGDTGYRYAMRSEPHWKAYIDQASRMGATKIRVWFCSDKAYAHALFAPSRRGLDLGYWAEIDRRLRYALEKHPRIQIQLILYSAPELRRYAEGDTMARLVARYAQARFSALPNIYWCISNDCEIIGDGEQGGRRVRRATIDAVGRDMAAREAWGTLLTNHQSRFHGYSFVDAPWSDIITLEDLDQVAGVRILEYRKKGHSPVVEDEDRYEYYRQPAHPRYFFRRLMWASLLSGGGATYGGLKTYEPFDGGLRGIQGYYDRADLLEGADDFQNIHRFFDDTGLTLVGMRPDDGALSLDPGRGKCIHNEKTFIVYLANPDGDAPQTANAGTASPEAVLALPPQEFGLRWFNPSTGAWKSAGTVCGPQTRLVAPGGGDWVALLRRKR